MDELDINILRDIYYESLKEARIHNLVEPAMPDIVARRDAPQNIEPEIYVRKQKGKASMNRAKAEWAGKL